MGHPALPSHLDTDNAKVGAGLMVVVVFLTETRDNCLGNRSIHPSIVTILCAERWCCLSSLLGYWAQSWTGRHSDTGYQQAGTHFADLGRMTGKVNPPGINSTAEGDPKPTTQTIKPTSGIWVIVMTDYKGMKH